MRISRHFGLYLSIHCSGLVSWPAHNRVGLRLRRRISKISTASELKHTNIADYIATYVYGSRSGLRRGRADDEIRRTAPLWKARRGACRSGIHPTCRASTGRGQPCSPTLRSMEAKANNLPEIGSKTWISRLFMRAEIVASSLSRSASVKIAFATPGCSRSLGCPRRAPWRPRVDRTLSGSAGCT